MIQPGGPGWDRIRRQLAAAGETLPAVDPRASLSRGILNFVIGTFAVYGALFGIGSLIYGRWGTAAALLALATVGGIFLLRGLLGNRRPA
jgi:solute:Na+ symporter, SSS family